MNWKESTSLSLKPFATFAIGLAGLILSMNLNLTGQTVNIAEAWSVPAGERDYLTNTGSFERGAAINPVNGHIYVISRNGRLQIAILDGESGMEIGFLDTTDINGGIFALSALGVADDGVIYAANLVVNSSVDSVSGKFRIYRWANESALPTLAYEGSPSDGMRFGDSLDVRGEGVATQIAAGSSGNASQARFAIFSTDNGSTFNAHSFSPTGVSEGDFQKGISFGEGDTLYGKSNGRSVITQVSFDTTTGASSILTTIPAATNISPINVHPALNLLAGIDYAAHELLVYDISNPDSPVQIATVAFPEPVTANGNGVGAVDFGSGKLIGLDTQNGLIALTVNLSETPEPPTIVTQPVSQATLEGGPVSFSVGATGTRPLSYQWMIDGQPIEGATEPTLVIDRATPENAGEYTATVTNAEGSATSEVAILSVSPLVQSGILSPAFAIAPGELSFLATDNAQRGAAYNPVSGRILVASRTEGDFVHVLDPESGMELHRLRTTDASGESFIFGGFFPLNMVVAAEDGAVYACNLSLSGADFTLYRWANDDPDTLPDLAFLGDTTIGRSGDSISVRGSGVNTEILIASRSGTQAVLFQTFDGINFEPFLINVEGINGGDIGLGLTFGEGDTFWATAPGRNVKHIAYDISTAQGTVVRDLGDALIPNAAAALAYDATHDFLAALTLEVPHTIRLYDLSNPEEPRLVDQELFKVYNPNVNGTGAMDFGGNRLFALNTNNGLLVFDVDPNATVAVEPATLSLTLNEGQTDLTLSVDGSPGASYQIQTSVDLQSWVNAFVLDMSTTGSATQTIVPENQDGTLFYRAIVNQ